MTSASRGSFNATLMAVTDSVDRRIGWVRRERQEIRKMETRFVPLGGKAHRIGNRLVDAGNAELAGSSAVGLARKRDGIADVQPSAVASWREMRIVGSCSALRETFGMAHQAIDANAASVEQENQERRRRTLNYGPWFPSPPRVRRDCGASAPSGAARDTTGRRGRTRRARGRSAAAA